MSNQMNPDATPPEFRAVARNMAVGVFEIVQTLDDLVNHALIGIDHRDAAVLRVFLPQLTNGQMAADDLINFWSTMPSDLYFNDGEQLRTILTAIQERIRDEPYLTGPQS